MDSYWGWTSNKLLKKKIKFLPKNVKVNLLGNLENSIVLDYLSKNYIDALINVSESEGLPFLYDGGN